jgi:hypothetical protein
MFVDRVAVGGKLDVQSIQGNAIKHDGHEHLTLPGGQLRIDRPAQRGQQLPQLGLVRGVETEPGRQPVPVLGIPRHGRVAPKVPPDLGRHLQDDELVRPGREPALAAELPNLLVIASSASAAA